MEKKDRVELAREMMRKAKDKLESAWILFRNSKFEDAVSRAYYAAFFAASAVLYLLGEVPKSHDGLIHLFGLKVIREGLVDKKYGRILSKLREARESSDYSLYTFFEKEEVLSLLNDAEAFIKEMERLINSMNS